MHDFINRHWIVFNPFAVIVYAHVALIVIFKLLGWEE